MTLPPADTAPTAIRTLADLVRRGIRVYRSPRAQECRAHYTSELRKAYDEEDPQRLPISGGKPLILKSRQVLKCILGKAVPPVLPRTWEAAVYEEYTWPPLEVDPDFPQQPFRVFLRIERGGSKLRIPIHDQRDPWLVPKFKARARFARFPSPPTIPIGTYLVYSDDLRSLALCQWIAVLLVQRMLLTPAEKDEVLMAFVAGRRDACQGARLMAFERITRTFLQPTGGWPSFPALFQKTWRRIHAGDVFMAGGLESVGTDTVDEAAQVAGAKQGIDGPWDEIALDKYRGRPSRSGSHRLPDRLIPLKQLRRQEPNLHRAILDRIARGLVRPRKANEALFVSVAVANRVDRERTINAAQRAPKRFPGQRTFWISRLTRTGIKRKSAERKVKRWINVLHLSEAEIEASVAAGRLVRRPPPA